MKQKDKKKLKKGMKVQFTAKILYRDKDGKSMNKELKNEAGKIAKIDGKCLYVKTKYGTHYCHERSVKPA